MKILGISCYYHDSAVAIIENGKILVAIQEERLSRIKHDKSFPILSINYCLSFLNISINEIDDIIYYEKPYVKFERIIDNFIDTYPKSIIPFIQNIPSWIGEKLFLKRTFKKKMNEIGLTKNIQLKFAEHHLSHAAQTYFLSSFQDASILIIDGVGENTTISYWKAKRNELVVVKEVLYPHSLGLLYSAFTYYLGFKVNSGEYKMMGLAPYGDIDSNQYKEYKSKIEKNLLKIDLNGTFTLNMNYFTFQFGKQMVDHKKWRELFGLSKREQDDILKIDHCNFALAIQHVVEEVVLKLLEELKALNDSNNLCLGGGFFMNCVVNGNVKLSSLFKEVFIPYSVGDSGGAIGAALSLWHIYYNNQKRENNEIPYLGKEYSFSKDLLTDDLTVNRYNNDKLLTVVVDELVNGKIIGWFQGRSEFGPRALGNRSIIADPRLENGKNYVNQRIKFRESFRPFAPSILESEALNYFNISNSKYMQFVGAINKENRIENVTLNKNSIDNQKDVIISNYPSITHVDYTSRIQTVNKMNGKFYELLNHFFSETGCPMLLNTSFNLRGEPIVESIEDALNCFNSTNLDILVVDNFIIAKKNG
ncbi:carbamoyltransferase N-terminal domain-containing protein [Flammeovirga sp. SubArs3]|uniref:carbamoyltransferase family protein n=1 Tax=Flammeovirga sp. SubArs3 TaxID=2995316 RepID=UPI00248ABA9B|nr:carbamoyltransferase N-terminal domain-containing protein [Flammeovirga sp. SubArs3]